VLINFALPGMAPRVLISSSGMVRLNSGLPEFQQYQLSKSATADLDGPDPESRDSPMCNSTSEVRAEPVIGRRFAPTRWHAPE
jgi:hypothetical protein